MTEKKKDKSQSNVNTILRHATSYKYLTKPIINGISRKEKEKEKEKKNENIVRANSEKY